MGLFFFVMAIKTMASDAFRYERNRRRTGSTRNAVLGLVKPADSDDMSGGMASRTTPEGKTVIVRTGKLSDSDIAGY